MGMISLLLNLIPVASLRLIMSNSIMKKWLVCMCFLPAFVSAAPVPDGSSFLQHPSPAPAALHATPAPLIIALEYENDENKPQSETASLQVIVPGEENPDNRRCMTVCSGWGEECVAINASTNGVTRKCMRTCTSFAKECL